MATNLAANETMLHQNWLSSSATESNDYLSNNNIITSPKYCEILSESPSDEEYYGFDEPIAKPVHILKPSNNSPGYLPLSSASRSWKRQDSVESENNYHCELLAVSKYESDFWTPSIPGLKIFSRNPKMSYVEEAVDAAEEVSSSFSGLLEEEDKQFEVPESPKLRKKRLSSFSSISLPKLPERSWFCESCRKPRDECQCLCCIS